MNFIITISREFGSGGRELGRRIADYLHIAYYDKEIVNEIAKETEFSKEYIEEITSDRPVPLFPIHAGISFTPMVDPRIDQASEVFLAQSKILNMLADKSSCVIIGRAADYILRDRKPYRIYVYSSASSKLKRCMERENGPINEKKMAKRIKAIDKQRRHYYEYYTGLSWGDPQNYDIMINTSDRDVKALALMIARHIKEDFVDAEQ